MYKWLYEHNSIDSDTLGLCVCCHAHTYVHNMSFHSLSKLSKFNVEDEKMISLVLVWKAMTEFMQQNNSDSIKKEYENEY